MNTKSIKLIAVIILGVITVISCSKNEVIIPKGTPKFSINSINKNFGIIENKTISKQEFTITNKGTANLEVKNIFISGTDEFITNGKKMVVKPNGTYKFQVTFKPVKAGNKKALLNIDTNDGKHKIELTGISAKPNFSITPDKKDFGNVEKGKSEVQEFAITNKGNINLEIKNIFLVEPKSYFITNGGKTIVKPNETYKFQVTFKPTEIGNKKDILRIDTNDGKYDIELKGTGTIAKFSINPTNKDFGIVKNNSVTKQEFIITNNGTAVLNINNFSFEGTNKSEFKTTAKATTVAVGKSYKFTITFNPTSVGGKSATLKITHNTGESSVVLKGKSLSESDFNTKQDAWIFFKDKPKVNTFIANPTQMLSAKALERRNKQGISLDEKDVPIEKSYYNQIKATKGVTVLAKSKWLNAVHIQANYNIIEALKNNAEFISKVEYADKSLNRQARGFRMKNMAKPHNKFEKVTEDFTYGTTKTQVEMLKADALHKKGFTGKGVVIAVIDAGFPNVNTSAPFKRIRDNNQILGGYDFVERNANFYTGNNHGTHVLSTIAGYIKNASTNFVGTAPDASFYLFRTENADKEEIIEESLWVEAAEKADSLGVDIINTSLGYTVFDNPKHNHTYADLDGKTAFMSRGAEIATSRGMIVINSAGNSGNKTWKYIGVPADAKSVLTVGAVTSAKGVAGFSSRGPTADGRTKPDVMALGFLAIVTNYQTGNPSITNGTSFSSPIMAGAIACLKQAYPDKKVSKIVEEVKKGGDKYTTPNNDYGYGIPNFETIFENLK